MLKECNKRVSIPTYLHTRHGYLIFILLPCRPESRQTIEHNYLHFPFREENSKSTFSPTQISKKSSLQGNIGNFLKISPIFHEKIHGNFKIYYPPQKLSPEE